MRCPVLIRLSSRSGPVAAVGAQVLPVMAPSSMGTRITVRLHDDLVAHLDRAVAQGWARSRAELVTRLIERDVRRQRAEDDLRRLHEAGALHAEEMLAIAQATSSTPLPLD